MLNSSVKQIQQPLGRVLSHIAKDFLELLHAKLLHIDLERNFYALSLIGKADGQMTQQELATQLDSDKVSIVRIIDYLTEKGYVIRTDHTQDRRKYCLTLTSKAKNEIADIEACLKAVHNQAYQGLSESQITEFQKILAIIQQNIKSVK
jgi:DNA-binding MarR family transcriptional regulator